MEPRRRRYSRPPLVEALAALHFAPGDSWDPTVFGRFYERVKDEYPERKVLEERAMSVSFPPTAPPEVKRRAGTLMRFVKAGGSALLQLAENLLVVNVVPQGKAAMYGGWQRFKPEILRRLEDYTATASPAFIVRLGLRYVNRFLFPQEGFSVGKAFARCEFIPKAMGPHGEGFLARIVMPKGESGRLIFTIGSSEPTDPGSRRVILDIDHVTEGVEIAPEPEELSKWLDDMHDTVEEVFESCLSPELRESLEPTS